MEVQQNEVGVNKVTQHADFTFLFSMLRQVERTKKKVLKIEELKP